MCCMLFHSIRCASFHSLHPLYDYQGDEARLVQEFGKVVRVYKSLKPGIQLIIKDITKKMGDGMAEFVSKDLGQGTVDLKEYDRYCHFVAGLVGDGLSRIFSESGQEVPEVRFFFFCALCSVETMWFVLWAFND